MELLRLHNPTGFYKASVRARASTLFFNPRHSYQSTGRLSKAILSWDSTNQEQSTKDEAALTTQDSPSESLVRHQPDYGARVDHATSTYSPVPKRVMDGSEPGDVVAAAVVSGAPVDLQARQVRIYRPAKTATQSGTWHAHHWKMDWDILQKGHRWENPLMGWQSSADPVQNTRLSFRTKEEAIQFAQKQGYEYFVQEPNEKRIVPKAYATNFIHEPKKIRHVRTK